MGGTPLPQVKAGAEDGKRKSMALLKQAIESLREQIEETGIVPGNQSGELSLSQNRKVFIVHGHDNEAKLEVEKMLRAGGFDAIILNELPSAGKSIIEKIESYDDVGFAVVLITPDDEGGKKGEEVRPRARQNVIFELGYFIAKLTRSRVCVLKRGSVEDPSDYVGPIWVDMDDAGGWKLALAKELINSGYELDLNKVLV